MVNYVDTSVIQTGTTLTTNLINAAYQWVDCKNGYTSIPGQQSHTFTATSNGSYAVIITHNGCTDTSSCYDVTGISIMEPVLQKILKIYPNPSSGIITLETSDRATLLVYNNTGMLIHSQEIPVGTQILNLRHFAGGIYTLRIIMEREAVTSRLIIRH